MDQREKEKDAVLDDGSVESCKKEKMKRSLEESCKAEAESMADDEATEVENPSPTLRECNICGKTFKSGKALGGHRRSHFQKVKVRFTNNSSKTGDHSNNNRVNNYDDYGKRICCICKKEFPTKNALFGHMRSHPERTWRGVSPPTQSHKNSSSSLSSNSYSKNYDSMGTYMEDYYYDDDCVSGGNRVIAPDDEHHTTDFIDLLKFTSPSWVKTDTRGRKCIGAIEAAQTLFFFRADPRYNGSGGSNRVSPKWDELLPKSAPPFFKRKIGESSSSKKHDQVKKIKFTLNGGLKIGKKNDDESDKLNRSKGFDDDDEEEGVEDVNAQVDTPSRVKKVGQKGKKSKKLMLKSKAKDTEHMNENGAQDKVGGYKCGACGKVFTTFQGLGGHRSVHKGKNIIVAMDESNQSEAVVEENNSSSSSNMHKVDEKEAPIADEPIVVNEATADEAGQSSGTKKLDFDLNELPCVMTEDNQFV